jgi:hypothetical protein
MAAKFSFIAFFKKLIDRRLGWLYVYWWVVTLFNVACLGYGMAVYYVACPYYYDTKACKSLNDPIRSITNLVLSDLQWRSGKSPSSCIFQFVHGAGRGWRFVQ